MVLSCSASVHGKEDPTQVSGEKGSPWSPWMLRCVLKALSMSALPTSALSMSALANVCHKPYRQGEQPLLQLLVAVEATTLYHHRLQLGVDHQ